MAISQTIQTPSVFSTFTVKKAVTVPAANNATMLNNPSNVDKKKISKKNIKTGAIILASLGTGAIIFCGIMAAAKKKTNSLSELTKILDDRFNTATGLVAIAKKNTSELTKKAAKELCLTFTKPHIISTELTIRPQDLKAKPIRELLDFEDNQFVDIMERLTTAIDEMPDNSEVFIQRYMAKREQLISDFNPIIGSAKKQIREMSDILPKNADKEYSREIVDKYNTKIRQVYEQADAIASEQLKNFDFMVGNHYGIVTGFDNILNEKNSRIMGAINDVYQGISDRINPNGRFYSSAIDESILDVIPASLPQSILQSHFLRFSRNVRMDNPVEFLKNVDVFTQELGKNFSVTDIDIMIARLKIRKIGIPEDGEWYNSTINKMKRVRSAVEKVLTVKLERAGKEIDMETLSDDDIQSVIESLQKHSERMGYSNVKQMMAGSYPYVDPDTPEELYETPIIKLYKKIFPCIKDGNEFYKQVLERLRKVYSK